MKHNLIILGAIFALLHLANLTEVLSFLSRPLVTGTATLFGIEAYNRGTDIVLGSLILPWTQDCSGVNSLIILWGVTLWANRQRSFDRVLVARLILCIPAALVANMLRIFTLAAYRYAFYPNWESEELHYLVGFLWLVPFLFLFVSDLRNMSLSRWIEIIYLSLVLALLAPVIFSPGGSLVALSALIYLSQSQVQETSSRYLFPGYLLWGLSALAISWAEMESFWIPWLLLCPRLVSRQLLFSLSGIVILSGTVSVLAMHFQWQIVVGMAIAYQGYLLFRGQQIPASITPPVPGKPEVALLALLCTAPFALAGVIGTSHLVEHPPRGPMTKQLTFNSYQLKMTRQPADIRMYWYGAFGDGRHHSLASCMRFRGVILEPVAETDDVMEGSGMWMRDYYIHEGELIRSYSGYLLASFSPFSTSGIHLIFDAPQASMSAEYFSRASDKLAKRIYEDYLDRQRQAASDTENSDVPG